MYAGSAIQFRDPFASTHTQHDRPRANWNPLAQITDFNRALTPPPDMTAHAPKPAYYQQERGHLQYNDYHQSQQPYRLPLARFNGASPPPLRNGGAASQPNSRPISPGQHPRQPIFNDPGARSRRASQAAVIAPTFQIPHSVNDSGGSLSELTAQITCLFWFESADILQLVDASHPPVPPPRLLSPDAKPTTGFRKWVTTILSTTLVAQNVVLLALLFIYRLKKLNPTVRGKPGSEYRLLTVALMLSNKFLDDNTYTNKTWAEVSGILVGEVHIMEVEFLSNMKYCLYTSAEDWASWQSLLGKFAAFFEQASKPHPAATLPSASSLPMPKALPSPPAAGQPSPPYGADVPRYGSGYNTVAQHGPTPAPSPLTALPQVSAGGTKGRKRSHEDHSAEPPAKRMASAFQSYTSPSTYASGPARNAQGQQVPRLTLPSLTIPPSSAPSLSHSHPLSQGQQLPPLNVPARAMAMVYPNSSAPVQAPHLPAPAGPSPQPLPQPHSQYQSRQHSPYPGSAAGSPSANMPASATSLQPPPQISPTYFLQQRNSPYRPVHNVSTLLYPPPSAALQQRPQNLEYHQMHYQPLGKPSQQRQSGHLPYVAQNVWLDGQGQQPMTPVSQWPSFSGSSRQAKPLRQH